eukprot:593590-Rhodomonas_salina.2
MMGGPPFAFSSMFAHLLCRALNDTVRVNGGGYLAVPFRLAGSWPTAGPLLLYCIAFARQWSSLKEDPDTTTLSTPVFNFNDQLTRRGLSSDSRQKTSRTCLVTDATLVLFQMLTVRLGQLAEPFGGFAAV